MIYPGFFLALNSRSINFRELDFMETLPLAVLIAESKVTDFDVLLVVFSGIVTQVQRQSQASASAFEVLQFTWEC